MSFPQRRARQQTAERPFAPAPLSPGRMVERHEHHLRRIHRRQDVAIGVLIALAALALGPGLAVVAIGAVIVLLVYGLSFAVVRVRGRRGRRLDRSR